jgi:hypothetical protein
VAGGCAGAHRNEPYQRTSADPASVVVVYYSRSGNTETAAFELARRFDADVVPLRAGGYGLGPGGYLKASWDAVWRRETAVDPSTVDLARYRLVFLGAPVWYWRPAPPLVSFVRTHRFDGAAVVVFLTLQSSYSTDAVDELGRAIVAAGGRYLGHVAIDRGDDSGARVIELTGQVAEANREAWLREAGPPSP